MFILSIAIILNWITNSIEHCKLNTVFVCFHVAISINIVTRYGKFADSIPFLLLQSPIVVWKMKAPEKKPLVRPEKPEEVRAKVRKASQKKVQNPIHALSEFQNPTDAV